MSETSPYVWFVFINADSTVNGAGTAQYVMKDFVEPPQGCTLLFISEVRYADTVIAPGSWKLDASGTDIERKVAAPVTVDKFTITANGIDSFTVSGIPNGSSVSVVGSGSEPAYVPVTDDHITVTTEDPGGIQVSIRSIGYTDWQGNFNAV